MARLASSRRSAPAWSRGPGGRDGVEGVSRGMATGRVPWSGYSAGVADVHGIPGASTMGSWRDGARAGVGSWRRGTPGFIGGSPRGRFGHQPLHPADGATHVAGVGLGAVLVAGGGVAGVDRPDHVVVAVAAQGMVQHVV